MRDTPDSLRPEAEVRLGPLSNSLGFLLRLSQLASFRDYFEDLGALGIRPGEASVLMLIAENPGVRQGVLARRLMIRRAHMTKMVRAMLAEGLVERAVPADDRRAIELTLTAKGTARVDALAVPFLAHEARPARGLSRDEEATLKRLLRRYIDLPDAEAAG
jgi:DNA-binding MarR family transcriptional regulator